MKTLRSRLEEKIQQKHLLAHPFYSRWSTGRLSAEALQGYAKEYYAFERDFPRYISSIHSKCENPLMRRALLENLIEEEKGETNLLELWVEFANGVGVAPSDLAEHFFSDETRHLLLHFQRCATSENLIDGLAALYAFERQQPDVARAKIDGLTSYYGVLEEGCLNFFRTHQATDVFHAETEANLLSQLCVSGEDEERAVKVVEETLTALYDFLDGIDRRYCH